MEPLACVCIVIKSLLPLINHQWSRSYATHIQRYANLLAHGSTGRIVKGVKGSLVATLADK
jgi:hypothetical protein